MFSLAVLVAIIIAVIVLISLSVVIVEQQTLKMIERLGKFSKVCTPGLNFKIPFLDWVAGALSLRITQLDVPVETKTQDNVFVVTKVSVQYQVIEGNAFDAFYKLNRPEDQIQSYVFDVVRATVPKIKLDDVFEKKDEIANDVKGLLSETMDDFGYRIVQALVTDLDPDSNVKASMNEINAQQRLRVAANEKGEAEKILQVKAAEAEAQSKKLQGEGIANQRKAIIDGLRNSVEEFKESVEGATAKDVMTLVLLTQYFDTMKDIGAASHSNVVFMPSTPNGLNDVTQQIMSAIMATKEA